MSPVQSYYQVARENEAVFRNVLRDLRENRANRPMGHLIPGELNPEVTLDEIFQKWSEGVRHGIFTITTFTRPEKDVATIGFQDIATLSGRGATLEYLVKEDNSVEYKGPTLTMMSLK